MQSCPALCPPWLLLSEPLPEPCQHSSSARGWLCRAAGAGAGLGGLREGRGAGRAISLSAPDKQMEAGDPITSGSAGEAEQRVQASCSAGALGSGSHGMFFWGGSGPGTSSG